MKIGLFCQSTIDVCSKGVTDYINKPLSEPILTQFREAFIRH